MRSWSFLALLAGASALLAANAQAPGARSPGSRVDYSGVYAAIYVGAPETVIPPDVYPFTPEGARAFEAFNPATDDPRVQNDCAAERMPAVLWSANPMEVIQEDRTVVIRFEAGDTVRSIPVDGPAPPADQPHTTLGYSIARWMGDVLTIETSHMMGGVVVNDMGQPISRDARITERYWREPGEENLQMELLVHDTQNYTEPLRLSRVWAFSPDEQVRPWQCVSLGSGESESLDVDELARMLEEL